MIAEDTASDLLETPDSYSGENPETKDEDEIIPDPDPDPFGMEKRLLDITLALDLDGMFILLQKDLGRIPLVREGYEFLMGKIDDESYRKMIMNHKSYVEEKFRQKGFQIKDLKKEEKKDELEKNIKIEKEKEHKREAKKEEDINLEEEIDNLKEEDLSIKKKEEKIKSARKDKENDVNLEGELEGIEGDEEEGKQVLEEVVVLRDKERKQDSLKGNKYKENIKFNWDSLEKELDPDVFEKGRLRIECLFDRSSSLKELFHKGKIFFLPFLVAWIAELEEKDFEACVAELEKESFSPPELLTWLFENKKRRSKARETKKRIGNLWQDFSEGGRHFDLKMTELISDPKYLEPELEEENISL